MFGNMEFEKPERREIPTINIVPILDMMTMIIFFIMIAASFIDFTKVTVPPSRTEVITSPSKPPPASPKLYVFKTPQKVYVQLFWSGRSPAMLRESFLIPTKINDERKDHLAYAELLLNSTMKVVEQFKGKYPEENTVQLGLASSMDYQSLITVMDGIQMVYNPPKKEGAAAAPVATEGTSAIKTVNKPANVILVSYNEVDAEVSKMGPL
jgi:biopolymer transport protein ExbD